MSPVDEGGPSDVANNGRRPRGSAISSPEPRLPVESGVTVTFEGVRGSTPCCGDHLVRYGGNTSCVSLERAGEAPIVLDMGTGLRPLGLRLGPGPINATILCSHLHWDHVQGLPFFTPIHHGDSLITVFGPPHEGDSLAETFQGLMKPPYFPVCHDDLAGTLAFEDLLDDHVAIGTARVTTRSIPHCGITNGYRVDWGGVSVAYISDHQEPIDHPTKIDEAVLALCDGVDLLIHDAQFTRDELLSRPHWGHCTAGYALEVAAQAGAAHLALFHHDPFHDDDQVDRLAAEVTAAAPDRGVHRVSAAAQGTSICLH